MFYKFHVFCIYHDQLLKLKYKTHPTTWWDKNFECEFCGNFEVNWIWRCHILLIFAVFYAFLRVSQILLTFNRLQFLYNLFYITLCNESFFIKQQSKDQDQVLDFWSLLSIFLNLCSISEFTVMFYILLFCSCSVVIAKHIFSINISKRDGMKLLYKGWGWPQLRIKTVWRKIPFLKNSYTFA